MKKNLKKEKIAYKIYRQIAKRGMTNQQFAKLLGVQPSIITMWLTGEHNFTLDTLIKIETKLKIDLIKV